MQIIIHRINKIRELIKINPKYGVEVDVRADGNNLILNHETFKGGDNLEKYLKQFKHAFIIFNIKEAGIEEKVIKLAKKYTINNFFLLDVEFPFIYQATRRGINKIAMRYSEDESIETVMKYKGKAKWVWIDTNTRLPLNMENVKNLKNFNSCLVCPERWGRPEDIKKYKKQLKKLNYWPDAVMTAQKYIKQWED